jgi:energy-coupling factor transporter ATP-binding protein EcfA2
MQRERIVIYGATGSGKSTLGRRLADALGLRHIELDGLFHGPNWTPTPDDEFLAKLRAAISDSPKGWVADGNYGAVRSFLLQQADTAIWLHLPWRVSYWRMTRRTVQRFVRKEVLWNGNLESIRNHLNPKESLLLWGVHHHLSTVSHTRAALAQTPHKADVFEVRSARELERLVERLTAESRGSAGAGAEASTATV